MTYFVFLKKIIFFDKDLSAVIFQCPYISIIIEFVITDFESILIEIFSDLFFPLLCIANS